MEIKQITEINDLKDAFAIRTKVFVEEQGVPAENEIDQYESESEHIVVYDKNLPIATGRIRLLKDYAKLQRICVLKQYRKTGVGKVVVEALEKIATKNGILKAKLDAQTHAKNFYENLGYKQISDEFLDEGIPHVEMEKDLPYQ